jgi:rSAM/selenodomain-associated transferase 2
MISAVIPTFDVEASLTACLAALVPAAVDGLLREVVIADGGSTDATLAIAEDAGAAIVRTGKGRGAQLAAGARQAKSPWLMFLHADTVLEPEWETHVARFMGDVDHTRRPPAAAAFRFALDDAGLAPRLLEQAVALRCRLFARPYGDQGLLIPRTLYDAVGGFRPMPLMEDLDLVRRLGRGRIVMLGAKATTSAARYRRDGYLNRAMRNGMCRALHAAGASPERVLRMYEGRGRA